MKDDPAQPEDSDKENNGNQESKEKKVDIPAWDKEFFEVDQDTLFSIIRAANFLEIRGLLDMGCMTVANLIKTKNSGEEIRQLFNIENNFTPEEMEQVKKENKWCEEQKK